MDDELNQRRWRNLLRRSRPQRPYVAFAATTREEAVRLYRAQNLIWVWLGLAAILAAATYFARPHLGPVLTSNVVVDITRSVLYAAGGALITLGVWTIRRTFEVVGHIFFSTGALLNTIVAAYTIPGAAATSAAVILLAGVMFASAFRAYFIVRWFQADDVR